MNALTITQRERLWGRVHRLEDDAQELLQRRWGGFAAPQTADQAEKLRTTAEHIRGMLSRAGWR